MPGDILPLPEVIVIADDLTGASDTAVSFSMRGLKADVLLEWPAESVSAAVIAISTASRDIPAPEARQRLKASITQLNLKRYPCIFKKIDSVFRGNTLDEIIAVIEEFPFDLAILAPAYPQLGRTSTDGVVNIRDLSGERSIPVKDSLVASGLHLSHIPSGSSSKEIASALAKAHRGECQLVYCDAASEADLEKIVIEGRSLAVRTLWIGSAGLGHALACSLAKDEIRRPQPPPSLPTPGSIVFFAGSDHMVTKAQIDSLREDHEIIECSTTGGPLDDPHQDRKIYLVPIKRETTTPSHISNLFARMQPENISCLFMTGGDTAALVCRALGIKSLQLQDEFAPGLPRGIAVGGRFDGATVILKSGGFGDADVLSRIAGAYQPDSRRKSEVAQ
jgi:uncharacterized protein YgbK (DUF1537 family)